MTGAFWRTTTGSVLIGALLALGMFPALPARADPAPEATVIMYPPSDPDYLPNLYSESVLGDFTIAGNSWLACPGNTHCDYRIASGVSTSGSGSAASPATANNSTAQIFVGPEALDRRGGAHPEAADESRALVVIPEGSRVVKALLSWNGDVPGLTVTPGQPNSVGRVPMIKVGDGDFVYPAGDAYVHFSGGNVFAGYADATAAFAEVDGPVEVATLPGPLPLSGEVGGNSAAGWSLLVVYAFDDPEAARDAGHFQRRVQIQQGMYYVPFNSAGEEFVTTFDPIPVDSGVHVGFVGSEGDLSGSGDRLYVIGDSGSTKLTPPWSSLSGGAFDDGRDNFAISVAQGAIPLEPIGAPAPSGVCDPINPCPLGGTYGFDYVPGDANSLEWYNNFSIDAFDWVPQEAIWQVGQNSLKLRADGLSDGYRIQQLAISTPVAQLTVETSIAQSSFIAGDTLEYTYRVDNPSPITVYEVEVTDTLTTPVHESGGTVDGEGRISIAPGESVYFTGEYVATDSDESAGQIVSNASATGLLAEDVSDRNAVNAGTAVLEVAAMEPPAIATGSLPNATAGEAYSLALDYSGTEPVTFEVTSGSLPTGFTLSEEGVISGSSTEADAAGDTPASFTIRASNRAGTDSVSYSLRIDAAALHHLVVSPADKTVLDGAEQTYTVEGFDEFGNSHGDLTDDVTFTSDNGADSFDTATVTVDGTGKRTITATIGSITGTATLTVHTVPEIVSAAPAAAVVHEAFSHKIVANGYPSPAMTVTGLPAGLGFDSATGTISGEATSVGSSTVEVVATNDAGTDSETYTLEVGPGPLHSITLTPATAVVELGASQTFAVDGFDEYGNERGAITGAVLTSDAGSDTIDGYKVTPGSVGGRTITAAFGAFTTTAALTVTAAPAITSGAPPRGGVDESYHHQLTANGYPSPTFEASGPLPPGLILNKLTGVISGTPSLAGEFTVEIVAQNNSGTDALDHVFAIDPVPALDLSNARAQPGQEIRIDGQGFWPGEQVELELHSVPLPLGQVTADANGQFTAMLNVPGAAELGDHRIVATGLDSSRVAESELELYKLRALAYSGFEPAPFVLAGSLLGALGLVLLRGRKRRQG